MSIVIEKNVPRMGKTQALTQALSGMDIGDSFTLPEGTKISTARVTAIAVAKSSGKKFSWRKDRCWRIA